MSFGWISLDDFNKAVITVRKGSPFKKACAYLIYETKPTRLSKGEVSLSG